MSTFIICVCTAELSQVHVKQMLSINKNMKKGNNNNEKNKYNDINSTYDGRSFEWGCNVTFSICDESPTYINNIFSGIMYTIIFIFFLCIETVPSLKHQLPFFQ